MKKIISVLVSASLIAALSAGCSSNDPEKIEPADTENKIEQDSGEFENPLLAFSVGLTDEGFFEGITASDCVKLPEYRGLTLPDFSPEQEEIDIQLEGLLEEYGTTVTPVSRPVQDGDTVNMDYVGSIDGVPFDGGSTQGQGTDVIIGVTRYIDGFLDQVIGHSAGENFDITVTFPDPYQGNDELSGKEAVFNITINSVGIATQAEEVTDEIAAMVGYESKDALIKELSDWIEADKKLAFMRDLYSTAECDEIPQSVIDYIVNTQVAYYSYYAMLCGMETDEYMATYGGYGSIDEFIEDNMDEVRAIAIESLTVQAIAETEGLRATEADVERGGYSQYAEAYGEPYIMQFALNELIVPEFIEKNAK